MAEIDKKKKSTLLSQYNTLLARYPLLINGVQAAILAGIAVFLSQLIQGLKVFDYKEIQIMMLINFAYHTPVLMWFTGVLAKSKMSLIPKIIVDQFIFSPLFVCGIVSIRLLLLGTAVHTIPNEVISIVPGAMLYSWCYWVPAKSFIFSYIPPMYQYLTMNAFSLVWNVIFAMILSP